LSKFQARITGGLGNQLFKFFNSVDLEKKLNQVMELDLTWYLNPFDSRNLVSPRSFDLNFYPNIRQVNQIFWNSTSLHKKSGQVLRHSSGAVKKYFRYLDESNRNYFIENSRKAKFVDGSFERLENLPNENTIKNFLELPDAESPWLSKKLQDVVEKQPIAIHVRRGDFMNLPELYDVVQPSYYFKSLNLAIRKYGKRPIHLFSDDDLSAIEFLNNDIFFDRVIKQEPGVQTAEIFSLLASYPIVISANSTFSWWAGYLGYINGTSKFVSMPEKFLVSDQIDSAKYLRHAGATIVSN
jgi:hypothetical protein